MLRDSFEQTTQSLPDSAEKPVVGVDLTRCSPEERPRMISIINRLAKSPLGLETLQVAAENGWHFSFCPDMEDTCGMTDASDKSVLLNPCFPDDKLVGTLCHECRHAGQFSRIPELDFGKMDVKTNLMYIRAMEADAQACTAFVCDELNRQLDKGPKRQFGMSYMDVALQFGMAKIENGGKLSDRVLTETFKGWYSQEVQKTAYEAFNLLQPMQKELYNIAAGKKEMLTFETSVPAREIVEKVAWTAKGCYFKDDPEILNGGKYMDVSEFTKEQMQKFFDFRKEKTGRDGSKMLTDIPTRPDTNKISIDPIKIPEVQAVSIDKKVVAPDKVLDVARMRKWNRGR